jgi:hypothetical protein
MYPTGKFSRQLAHRSDTTSVRRCDEGGPDNYPVRVLRDLGCLGTI